MTREVHSKHLKYLDNRYTRVQEAVHCTATVTLQIGLNALMTTVTANV